MRALILIFLAAVPTYLGYYFLSTPENRSWAYYVGQGALVLVLADCIRRGLARGPVAALALMWWIEIESVQQVVCGAIQWGHPVHTDLCVQTFGADFYRAVAALAMAGLLAWPSRRH